MLQQPTHRVISIFVLSLSMQTQPCLQRSLESCWGSFVKWWETANTSLSQYRPILFLLVMPIRWIRSHTHTQTQLKAKYVICASCLSHFVTVLFFWSFPLTFEINCNPLLPLHTRDLMWEEQLDGIGNDWLVVSHFKLIVNEADLSLSLSLFLPLSLCLCLCVV